MDKVISCIVLAAGAGRRMAYKENKIFIPLGRYSIIQRTLQNVAKLQGLSEIILVVAEGEQEYMTKHIQELDLSVPVHIVLGQFISFLVVLNVKTPLLAVLRRSMNLVILSLFMMEHAH